MTAIIRPPTCPRSGKQAAAVRRRTSIRPIRTQPQSGDATDGRKISQATFTGYDYSDLPRVFRLAGARTDVRVLSDRPYGDSFFARSDNAPLADQGVPAHTLAVAFDFPDYHKVTDEWRKIDYDNMAKVAWRV